MRNGKGSTPRQADVATYNQNFDRIFGPRSEADDPRPWGFADREDADMWDGPYETREEALQAARAQFCKDIYLCRPKYMDGAELAGAVVSEVMAKIQEEALARLDTEKYDGNFPHNAPADAVEELEKLLRDWGAKHLAASKRLSPWVATDVEHVDAGHARYLRYLRRRGPFG